MIDSGRVPACLRGGRYYGFQSVPSVATTTPEKDPIIAYGYSSVFYLSSSSDILTIDENLSSSINVSPLTSPYKLKPGWIVYLFGGNQRGKTRSEITVETQKDLAITVEANLTFRVGQSVTIVLSTDNSQSMVAVITSFDPATGAMVVDVTSATGSGTYPILPYGYWAVDVVGLLPRIGATSLDWMLARISSVDVTDPANPVVSFDAYQSSGSGTYESWSIVVQWEYAQNFIRNDNRVAFDASIGPNTNEWLGELGAVFIPAGGDATTEIVDTSEPPLINSGYTQRTVKGYVEVIEDQYMTHRPYIGRTVKSKIIKGTTIDTTTITYDPAPPYEPTYVTVRSEESETLEYSYTFTNADFNKTPPHYQAGNSAYYADGEIVFFPSPGRYGRDVDDGSIVYKSFEHKYTSEAYPNPDDPSGPPLYRLIEIIDIRRDIGSGVIPGKPTPQSFFWPG